MMKYNNADKDLRVKIFYLLKYNPVSLEENINDFLSNEAINIINIESIPNKSVFWVSIYYTELKSDLDGVL